MNSAGFRRIGPDQRPMASGIYPDVQSAMVTLAQKASGPETALGETTRTTLYRIIRHKTTQRKLSGRSWLQSEPAVEHSSVSRMPFSQDREDFLGRLPTSISGQTRTARER